ncbi:MAG: aminotransferase class IV [Pyrinomonadaceae bacterium]|nr:aminotransferase class IV [Pyrinomonadaceae bacterium]
MILDEAYGALVNFNLIMPPLIIKRMHPRIILNDKLMNTTRARVQAVTGLSLYGRGVFTTLAIYNNQPFLWSQHFARLMLHAARLSLDASAIDEARLKAQLEHLIDANKVSEGRARITLLARDGTGLWQAVETNSGNKTDVLIITGDRRAQNADGLALTLSPFRLNTLSPIAGLKTVNYLEHILSWEEACGRQFDEAVVMNERGEVVSTTMANIFWTTHGTLHTPALSTGAIAGTTRARVIELAHEAAVPFVEGVYELSDLADADEIFLTSAGLGLALVTTFDFRNYTLSIGSPALRLREAFRQLTLEKS